MKARIKKVLEFLLITSLVMVAFMMAKANAQQLTGGITAGVSTGSAKISNIPDEFVDVIKGNNIFGVQGGVFGQFTLSPFYIKPMLVLNYQHGTINVYENDASMQHTNFTMEKLEVPLLFGFKIFGPFSIEAGPVYNYILHSTNNFAGNSVQLKKSSLGYRAGAAAEFGRLNLSVSYEGITMKSSDSSTESTFQSPYEIIFGLGINLGKH